MWTSALFLKAIFTSKFVEGTKPLSPLFIAESGSAKTDLTGSYESLPSTWRVPVGSSGTGILKKLCQMEDRGHEIDFLIIDDLIPTLNRGRNLANRFVSMMLNLLESGRAKPESYDMEKLPDLKRNVPLGLIAGVTRSYVYRYSEEKKEEVIRGSFLQTGFLERMLPWTYIEGKKTVEAIRKNAWSQNWEVPELEICLPTKSTKFVVEIGEDFCNEISSVAVHVKESANTETNTNRTYRDLVALAKSIRLMRFFDNEEKQETTLEVEEADMVVFRQFARYINFDFNKLEHEEEILEPLEELSDSEHVEVLQRLSPLGVLRE